MKGTVVAVGADVEPIVLLPADGTGTPEGEEPMGTNVVGKTGAIVIVLWTTEGEAIVVLEAVKPGLATVKLVAVGRVYVGVFTVGV